MRITIPRGKNEKSPFEIAQRVVEEQREVYRSFIMNHMPKQKSKHIVYCPKCGSKLFETEVIFELTTKCWNCRKIVVVMPDVKVECFCEKRLEKN